MTSKTIFEIWTCVFCKTEAKNALNLEMQFLDGDDILFWDDDNTVWYRCANCAVSVHYSCLLQKIQINVSYSDFRKDVRFYCC